jgi:HlyD family secretion protein
VTPGEEVAVGTRMLRLERPGGALEAVLYVPAADAASVRPGVEVQIAPASVKKDEYGALLGQVSAVGTFPASRAGMERALGSDAVAATLAAAGPRVEVRAQLTPSQSTFSGYRWTSALSTTDAAARDNLPAPLVAMLPMPTAMAGPPITLASGTLCSADLVTEQQAPIRLMLARLGR